MRRCFFLLAVFTLLFSSCILEERKNAQVFHDRLIVITDSLRNSSAHWHETLRNCLVTKDFTPLNVPRIQFASYMSDVRAEIVNTHVNSQIAPIRHNLDSILAAELVKTNELYPQFEQFSGFTPKEVLHGTLRHLGNDSADFAAAVSQIDSQLAAYSKHYSLRKSKKR